MIQVKPVCVWKAQEEFFACCIHCCSGGEPRLSEGPGLNDTIPHAQVHDSPLKVAVKHLRDEPYDPSDDTLKATTLEIVSTLKELLHLHPLYNEQLRRY